MTVETLKNQFLEVSVASLGAELQSIKDSNGKEYLWDGNPEFWGRRSSILFPIVCGLWQGQYRTEGQTFKMERHGFARDTEFELIRKTEDRLTYVLKDSEETMKLYPYRFMLSITYRLEKNTIHVIWHVHNTDTQEIHFQIGGHPAFCVPGCNAGEPLKGKLDLHNEKPVERIFGNVGGCIIPGHHEVPTENSIWEFNEESFKDDAVIFDQSQIKSISLLDEEDKPAVTLNFRSPAVGIWSPYGKHAPFVCIEPWYGIHDFAEFKGEFRDKYLMNHLQPGASFLSEYTIEIG